MTKLYQKHSDEGERFIDSTFMPTDKSIYLPGYGAKPDDPIIWVRATEMIHNSHLITQYEVCNNVIQGAFGGWTVAAARLFALHPQVFKQVVPITKKNAYKTSGSSCVEESNHPGIFRFRFFRFGTWVEVVVDDFLPCTTQGEWLCSLSKNKQNLWVPLLEKAFSKLNGSYQLIKSIKPCTSVFADLTGNIPEQIDLSVFSQDALSEDSMQLFNAMDSLMRGGALISCFFQKSNPFGNACTDDLCSDMYAVTKVFYTHIKTSLFHKKTVPVVQIYKPFLNQSSSVSHTSPDWPSILAKERKQLNLSIGQDGQFTVLLLDFLREFSTMIICRMFDQPNRSLISRRVISGRYYGRWSKADKSDGGSLSYPYTVCNNPQFLLDIRKSSEVIFYLQRRHANHPTHSSDISIGLIILKVEENRDFRITDLNYQQCHVSNYTSHTEVFCRCILKEGRYVVIPTTYRSGQEGDFFIRFYTLIAGSQFCPLIRHSPQSMIMGFLSSQTRQSHHGMHSKSNTFRIEIVSCNVQAAAVLNISAASSNTALDFDQPKPPLLHLMYISKIEASLITSSSKASSISNSSTLISNSYCIVRCSEESSLSSHTTRRSQTTSNCDILNSFVFGIRNITNATIKVELWSVSETLIDKLVGYTSIDVAEFASPHLVGTMNEFSRTIFARNKTDSSNWCITMRVKYDGLPVSK
ncbi:hypothetical protein BATDEDRAFT_85291 [Batrachochytrium dendrobatidis JAM81]|uniref:Calpain catalytic domain-containing protein n=1 Tax=Batrachochytrium dendrobatidis (strain JAM81 / FGSC 10211) TaxID=684364 RepID=F4NTM9_BATDJ|nr:uncharacterized protein BATDEDRAFT_85291 [Batrachochytrium dendrobatidis JAM81]EGF84352.1 hypothetical protein BATDEDRAFT_85291 [Batrachochytrium dendrobatidis JAM81]|eukprot:XP_006676414.1 hypothetical protein BATDEDRAFT_85291 [Batrachochytrium dendrobatidis JAM81]